MKPRYRDLNSYLRNIYGVRVQKISVDAGMTCPNRDGALGRSGCIYCNARGSGTGAFSEGQSITEQLEKGKDFLGRRYKAKKFLAYFQSYSNTYAPVEILKRLYDEALSVEGIIGLSIGTRPDLASDAVLDLIASYTKDHLIWLEFGLQSSHDKTLQFINRGHDFACFRDAVERAQKRGILVCVHVILGLPEETADDMNLTAERLAAFPIDGVKLHLLYVVKGTKLHELYLENRYQCLTREEYAERVCDFLERMPDSVVVQRITGDPHPEELAAPEWSLDKRAALDAIMETFEKRGSYQGKRCEASFHR